MFFNDSIISKSHINIDEINIAEKLHYIIGT